MKKENNRRPRNVRKRILEEATRQFSEHGYSGTTIQSISEIVGIQKPSLLYHFSSKKELYEAVMADLMLHWKNEMPRLLAAATDGRNRFDSTLNTILDFFRADKSRARLAMRVSLDDPPAIHAMVKEHLRPWIKLVVAYIKQGKKSDIIRKEVDPELWIIQVLMMILGTVAFGNVSFPLYDMTFEDALEPEIAELVRMARVSLFVDKS